MRPWYRFCRLFCQLFFLLFFRGRVFHQERVPTRGGVLLVCNHQSFLDPVLATQALPRECAYMARDTLFRNSHFRRLIESLNAFPVKRGSSDVGAIKETLRRLKDGQLITLFPEGTRTPDGRIHEMQPGAVLLARKAKVPIVPTLILGAFECWPRHALLPSSRPIIVAHGEPIPPQMLQDLPDQAAIDFVRDRILELQRRYERHPLMRG